MKKTSSLFLFLIVISFANTACQKAYLSPFAKKYSCRIEGEPNPITTDEFASRGARHALDGNYECAFDACSEAIRLDSKNALAHACRGHIYTTRQEYDSALRDLDEAIRLDPSNYSFYYNRARLFQRQHQFGKALEDMSTAVKMTGDNELSYYNYVARSEIYIEMGDYENALKDISKAISLKPDYKYHYDARAAIYRKLGKNDLAEADEDKFNELELIENSEKADSSSGNKVSADIVLNKNAISLPKPTYPASARAVKAKGEVKVQVQVDESGNVTSAKTVYGDPLLHAAAEQAARQAKFKPILSNGKAVKVSGIVIYNFTAE